MINCQAFGSKLKVCESCWNYCGKSVAQLYWTDSAEQANTYFIERKLFQIALPEMLSL